MKKCLIGLLILWGVVASGMAYAEIHALIMTIGDYQGGITKLKGVLHDRESARSIAHLLGVKDENMLQFHDEQLSLEGIRHAFDELDRRVAPGDKVFVYYSGHGGRQRVHDPEERCAESLVSVNGYAFIDAEMEVRLKHLAERAQKIIAMFDACHSGGATVRGLGNVVYAPKYWSKGGRDACQKPVNVITRNLEVAARSAGSGGNNYVYIAAARDNEISLDQPGKGGVATQAWLACMSGDAVDLDGSGGLTVEEIRSCAQNKINARLKNSQGFLPHHINVIGNPDLVMTLATTDQIVPQQPTIQTTATQTNAVEVPITQTPPVSAVQPDEPPASAVQINAPPVSNAQTVVPPVTNTPQPIQVVHSEPQTPATLLDIFHGRDDRRTVEIVLDKNRLKIGKDKFSFSVRSSQEGYLYLIMVGSDGKTFDLLFPNKLDSNNFIQAGQTVQFPRSNWEIIAQGPAGKDHILAIVADAPRDLSKLPVTNAGAFSMVVATAGGKRGIQLVTSTPSIALQKECRVTGTRNLAVARVCSDAYGAALTVLEEDE